MTSLVGRVTRLLTGARPVPAALDGFVDSLLSKFENCRSGLTDESLQGGSAAVEAFFLKLYEEELPRLRDTIRLTEPLLSKAAREELFRKVDDLVRRVVLPAYVRLALRYTRRERNGFYALPDPLHGVERLLWAVAGMAAGGFVVWAPFIPLWSKEWVLPFTVGGLLFPELRRWLSSKRYEEGLNDLVERTDREILRVDLAYLTEGRSLAEREAEDAAAVRGEDGQAAGETPRPAPVRQTEGGG